ANNALRREIHREQLAQPGVVRTIRTEHRERAPGGNLFNDNVVATDKHRRADAGIAIAVPQYTTYVVIAGEHPTPELIGPRHRRLFAKPRIDAMRSGYGRSIEKIEAKIQSAQHGESPQPLIMA